VVELSGLDWSDPAPFAPDTSLGEALLMPTRLYVKSCLDAIRSTGAVKALAHITGGGFPDNIPRALPAALGVEIDLSRIAVPPVFRWLSELGGIPVHEMLRTFNCGIGMVAIVAPDKAEAVLAALRGHGETAEEIGVVVPAASDARVTYQGALDLLL
jgi:phosphoribosylformylglycinamidine cyclo-ligase